MLDFITRIFSRDGNSKNVAKERLRLVLVHDRADISPQLMEDLKSDLVKVISKYMEIDVNSLEFSLDSNDNQVALIANIPVKKMKRSGGAVTGV